jgi:sugar phosphate permease
MTFALGGIGFWVAAYLHSRGLPAASTQTFGALIAGTGLLSTLVGGWRGDALRKKIPGPTFLVSGLGMILACHCSLWFSTAVSASLVGSWAPQSFPLSHTGHQHRPTTSVAESARDGFR